MGDQSWHSVDLPHGRDAGPQARGLLRAALGPDGAALPDHALADVLIVAGELVENAVDHGEPSALGAIQFSWRLHGARVEVCVVDSTSGPGFSHEARDIFDLDSARGRGLMMVDVISERWAVEQDPTSGTTAVSAVLSVG